MKRRRMLVSMSVACACTAALFVLRTHSERNAALLQAVVDNDPELVRDLLAGGADPNMVGRTEPTSLHQLIDFILKARLSRGRVPKGHTTPLLVRLEPDDRFESFLPCYSTENVVITRLLLDYGADVNTRDHDGDTPLMLAVIAGEQQTARLLIERGADLTATDSGGHSAADFDNNREPGYRVLHPVTAARRPPSKSDDGH